MKPSVTEGLKKTAVLCILRHHQEFLLLKRLKEPNKDMYTPVGGKLDPFESPYEAAIRETSEETGITLSHMRYCGILVETSPTKYNWCSFVYVADIDRIPPPPCNEGTLEWIALDSVPDMPTPETDWHIYQYVMQSKPFAFQADFNENLELLRMTEDIEGKVIVSK
jgi:8-oxo-dGTP diphosphatase